MFFFRLFRCSPKQSSTDFFNICFRFADNANLNTSALYENNNLLFATSTPKIVNGNRNELYNANNNGSYDTTIAENVSKEQFMNNVNANTTSTTNGTNTTTVIADIEGETKKKIKFPIDKTFYIAKEILMTELTYKKDLDVINIVSLHKTPLLPCKTKM